MPINPLPLWKTEFADIAPSNNQVQSASDIANFYSKQISAIQPAPLLTAPGFTFPFQTPLLQAGLLSLVPAVEPVSGALTIATAWESAILATIPVVPSGAIVGAPPTPATTFSVVEATIIDPPSIAAGKALIMSLLPLAPPIPDPLGAQLPNVLFQATSLLTITVTGKNSIPPPSGPTPLVAPFVPLL
jgi:hypothetical protein